MNRKLLVCALLFLLAACATKPPVQEMAEARSAVRAAQALPGEHPGADFQLKSAEQSLREAADAIEQEKYELARLKALEAKRQAQSAAKIKQSQQQQQ